MNRIKHSLFLLLIVACSSENSTSPASHNGRQRLVVLADMGNEPDEMQQMIHMITCSNEFDIEGLHQPINYYNDTIWNVDANISIWNIEIDNWH